MKFIVTAHPINKKFQESLGIYKTSIVPPKRLGTVLRQLVLKGYDNIHSFTEDGFTFFHCKKEL